MVRPLSSERVFFPGLDGLRFIAALSVLVQHVVQFQLLFGFGEAGWFHRLFLTGRDGVILFFVLSGFLITYLLLAEGHRDGSIDVSRFYLRRILRIWPLYFLVLSGSLAIYLAFGTDIPAWQQPDHGWVFALYALFLANVAILITPALGVSQSWSIAVEEQFYVIWPWLLLIFARGLILFMVVFVALKVLLLWSLIHTLGIGAKPTLFVQQLALESMAVGAIAAVLVYRRSRVLSTLFHPVAQFATVVGFVCVVASFDRVFHWTPSLATTLLSLVFAMLILNVGCNEPTLLRLRNPVLDYLGRISYGIYMLSPLCTYGILLAVREAGWDPGSAFSLLAVVYIAVLAATVALAALSYRFFETPFLRLKKRFAHIESGGDSIPVSGFAGLPATAEGAAITSR